MEKFFQPQLGFEAVFLGKIPFFNIDSLHVWISFLVLTAFLLAMTWAPAMIGPLLKFSRQRIDPSLRPTLSELHKKKVGTPSMGGILFVVNTAALTFLLVRPLDDQIVIFVGAMLAMGIVGATDDYLVSWGTRYAGLTAGHKFFLQFIVSSVIGLQLFWRLDYRSLIIPFVGRIDIGWLIVPVVILVLISTINAVNLTDGLDGLAAGVSVFAYIAYLIIALWQHQFALAALGAILIGSVLAFLWFNIYPARFFMGDVGSLTLGLALGLFAIYTEQIYILPIVALVFVLETISVILQICWRIFFKKKLFTIAPFHHHFEKKGWPETKVSQRFWLVGALAMVAGLFIYALDLPGLI